MEFRISKYLGEQWSKCTDLIYKKSQQRQYFLKKLGPFNVDCTALTLFYKSSIESISTFCVICWFGNATVRQTNMLRRIINTASKVLGVNRQAWMRSLRSGPSTRYLESTDRLG